MRAIEDMCFTPQAIGFSNLHDSCKCCLNILFSALLHKILVENPSVRITIPDIKKDRWYNKPLKKGNMLKIQVLKKKKKNFFFFPVKEKVLVKSA